MFSVQGLNVFSASECFLGTLASSHRQKHACGVKWELQMHWQLKEGCRNAYNYIRTFAGQHGDAVVSCRGSCRGRRASFVVSMVAKRGSITSLTLSSVQAQIKNGWKLAKLQVSCKTSHSFTVGWHFKQAEFIIH